MSLPFAEKFRTRGFTSSFSDSFSMPYDTYVAPSFTNSYSVAFDGTNDQVLIPYELSGTNFSVSFWFKQSDTANGEYLWDSRNSGSSAWAGWTTYQSGSNSHVVRAWCGTTLSGSTSVSVGDWAHVVVTKEGDKGSLYVNGSLDTTSTTSDFSTITTSDIKVGTRYNGANAWAGNVDEFAVWNSALDADAVAALYNSGSPTDVSVDSGDYDASATLQGWWRMGDATNPAADGTSSRVDTLLFDQKDPGLGTELSVADPYTSGRWGGLGTNTPTFVAGESVRIDRPATGGNGSGGYSYLTDDSGGFLTEDLATDKVYKFTLLFETDDSDAVVNVYGDGGIYQSSSGSGLKTFYLFGHGTGTYMTFGNIDNGKFVKVSELSVKQVNGATATMNNMDSGAIEEDTP